LSCVAINTCGDAVIVCPAARVSGTCRWIRTNAIRDITCQRDSVMSKYRRATGLHALHVETGYRFLSALISVIIRIDIFPYK